MEIADKEGRLLLTRREYPYSSLWKKKVDKILEELGYSSSEDADNLDEIEVTVILKWKD